MNKALHLNLKRKWFDMFLQDVEPKVEEYREIKSYWIWRFLESKEDIESQIAEQIEYELQNLKDTWNNNLEEFLKHYELDWQRHDSIIFSNGYKKDRPQFKIKLINIEIDSGFEKWGAVPNKKYFVLECGQILWRRNV